MLPPTTMRLTPAYPQEIKFSGTTNENNRENSSEKTDKPVVLKAKAGGIWARIAAVIALIAGVTYCHGPKYRAEGFAKEAQACGEALKNLPENLPPGTEVICDDGQIKIITPKD